MAAPQPPPPQLPARRARTLAGHEGAVLAVRRAPSDPRTFVLVGDGGSYALRLARGVEVSGVGDRELLTRVFSTRAWERALEPLELPGKGR